MCLMSLLDHLKILQVYIVTSSLCPNPDSSTTVLRLRRPVTLDNFILCLGTFGL